MFVEHRLVGSRADYANGLARRLRFGIADTRFNRIGRYLGGGLVHTGIVTSRPDDQVGISFASVGFGHRYWHDRSAAGDYRTPSSPVYASRSAVEFATSSLTYVGAPRTRYPDLF